jgi:hypothetical protein
MRELTKNEIYDILYGCTILGTGGGGSLDEGLALINRAFNEGRVFRLASLDEIADEDLIITPYYCGSISPDKDELNRKFAHLKEVDSEPVVKAVEIMEDYLNRSVNGIISTELGGGNTAAAFYTASVLGKYIVDADPAGRAVPELQHSTYFLNDLPMAPIAVANRFGESAIITEVVDDFRAEAFVRSMAVVSKNAIAVADHLCTAIKLKSSVISGAITYALKIGCAYRIAQNNNMDSALAVAKAGNGIVAFKGEVSDYKWETLDGFTIGNVKIDGTDVYKGQKLNLWFKNEHLVSWIDGRPYVCAPDLICLFNGFDGNIISNPYYENKMPITMVVLPSPEQWTTTKGLEVFSAKSFGFDIEYVPFSSRINNYGRIEPQNNDIA